VADEVNVNDALKAKGFDSVDKVLEALESAKADLAKHKTRASELDDLKNRLQAFENEKAERENAAKTEAEKLADKVKALETEREQFKAEAAKAARQVLLERGLGENMGSVPEKLRPVADKFLRTVLPTMDWNDPETLKAAIAEQLADLTADAPPDMKPVVSGDGQNTKGPRDMPNISSGQSRTGFSFTKAIKGEK
jgi:chromosome segregation ATPase